MPNSLDFRRKLRMALPEQVGFQKTSPEVPIVFRGSCGNPESRQYAVLALGIGKRVDWGRGTLQNCSLSQDPKKNSLTTVNEFTLFLQILNLSQEPTLSSWKSQFIHSQLSGSICFFRNRFFVINQFFSLSQICPLIRQMQLSIGFIIGSIRTSLFPISSGHFCLSLR